MSSCQSPDSTHHLVTGGGFYGSGWHHHHHSQEQKDPPAASISTSLALHVMVGLVVVTQAVDPATMKGGVVEVDHSTPAKIHKPWCMMVLVVEVCPFNVHKN